ncbi:hypothetical protein LTR85_000378 [Meristemomyces frigidus]|nr:hypothetical protein LTR85_000378 [Meristemomyces frigidus]
MHEKKRRTAFRNTSTIVRREVAKQTQFEGEASTSGQNPVDQNDKEFKRHLVRFVDQRDIDKRAIHQGVRITYLGTAASNVNFLVRGRGAGENSAIYHYPTDQISRHLTGMPVNRIPLEAFALPEKAVVDSLLENYFVEINRGFPILDEEVFMSQYQGRNPANPPSLLALHAALMVGAHVACSAGGRDQYKSLFFHRAKMLFDARFERDRDVVVQAAVLMSWYSDGAEDVCANAWSWIGVAARTAQGLGMHRDTAPSNLIEQDKRIWRRAWWMLVQCDVFTSLFHGRPMAINLEDCDVRELTHDDFRGCFPDAQADFQIQRSAICIIIARAQRVFSPRVSAEECRSATLRADQELSSWYLGLPEALRYDAAHHDRWAAQLMLAYYNLLILLHRTKQPKRREPEQSPSSTHQGASDISLADAEICNASAQAVVSILEYVCMHDEIRYIWLDSVNALFTALTHLSTQMPSANPVLAMGARRQFDSGLRTLKSVAEWWPIECAVVELFESQRPGNDASSYEESRYQPLPHGSILGEGVLAKRRSAREHLPVVHELTYAEEGKTTPLATPVADSARTFDWVNPDAAAPARVPSNAPSVETASYDREDNGMQEWRHLFPFSETDQTHHFVNDDAAFGSGNLQWLESGLADFDQGIHRV